MGERELYVANQWRVKQCEASWGELVWSWMSRRVEEYGGFCGVTIRVLHSESTGVFLLAEVAPRQDAPPAAIRIESLKALKP
jgi:hypothetical protein